MKKPARGGLWNVVVNSHAVHVTANVQLRKPLVVFLVVVTSTRRCEIRLAWPGNAQSKSERGAIVPDDVFVPRKERNSGKAKYFSSTAAFAGTVLQATPGNDPERFTHGFPQHCPH
ncbi:hypothetical protein [Variovorax paradoxus]|uniref:hypothetical protein n=1 Tax=Variovorax paradoxus TaxID=34073 RepID=UPI0012D42A2C|nr:hypothetical protein [Variovorax paradoxus]